MTVRFRQSFLKNWASCGLKAKFESLDGLPTPTRSKQLFGTIIHSCLEGYDRTGNVDVALKMFVEDWHDVDPDMWDRYTSFEGLRQEGIRIIKDYHSRQRWEQRKVIAVEHRFLVPFGEHELEGTIDLLQVKKNHRSKELLQVCDRKTTSRKPSFAELYLDVQGTVYTYATHQKEFWLGNGDGFPPVPNGEWWYETLKDMPRRFIWHHLWTDSEIDGGERKQIDFDRVYRQCCEIERAIEHEVYIPTISHSTCSYCSFVDGPCPVSVPKREDVIEEENAWL